MNEQAFDLTKFELKNGVFRDRAKQTVIVVHVFEQLNVFLDAREVPKLWQVRGGQLIYVICEALDSVFVDSYYFRDRIDQSFLKMELDLLTVERLQTGRHLADKFRVPDLGSEGPAIWTDQAYYFAHEGALLSLN